MLGVAQLSPRARMPQRWQARIRVRRCFVDSFRVSGYDLSMLFAVTDGLRKCKPPFQELQFAYRGP